MVLHLACVQSKFNVALVQIKKALGELYSSFSDNIKRYKTGSHWSKQHKPSIKISLRLMNFKFYFTIHPSQLIIILKVIEMLRWRAFKLRSVVGKTFNLGTQYFFYFLDFLGQHINLLGQISTSIRSKSSSNVKFDSYFLTRSSEIRLFRSHRLQRILNEK